MADDDPVPQPASLESDPAPEPAAPAEPTPAPAPTPEADDLPEGAIEQAGQVMVPLAALKAEREQVRALKPRAAHADQVAQWYQQVRPYVDFLQAHPDLLTRQTPPATAEPAQPDPQFDTLARTLDLYTAEGKPDAGRAKQVTEIMRAAAREEAQTVVKPVQQGRAQERSLEHFEEAAKVPLPSGGTINRNLLWSVWNQFDSSALSTKEGAAAALAFAIGMQTMQSPGGVSTVEAPAGPPVVTESPTGRFGAPPPISDLDRRVMRVRGIDAKKYEQYAKQFKPGQTNVLEE